MTEDQEMKLMMHQMNAQSTALNRDIIQKSATMQDIPVNTDIYQQAAPQPQPQLVPSPQVVQAIPQQINTDPGLLNSLIDRVASVEKQLTKFVNLIENRIAKNAKEINIRIKLDDKNDSTNKE